MATRNLTKKFVDIRNASKANRSLNIKSTFDHPDDSYSDSDHLKGSSDASAWKTLKSNSLPPRWVEDIERTEEAIARIENKIKELGVLHAKRLKVDFDTDEELKEFEINTKTKEITDSFHEAEMLLKRFSANDEKSLQKSELTVKTNIQRAIAKRLQGLSMSFRRSQKEYMGRLKAQKAEASGGGVFDFANESAADSTKPTMTFVDDGFTQSQLQVVDEISTMVDQRDQEIVNIAKSIEELAQIFKELAVLVIDQGTILDRIDYNMETAVEHAKEGIEQLHKAEEHQKNSLPLKCIIVLVVLIAIMVIVLIVKHSSSSTSSTSSSKR